MKAAKAKRHFANHPATGELRVAEQYAARRAISCGPSAEPSDELRAIAAVQRVLKV